MFGGPSFFSVKQDIVNDFEISETYPYDTATFTRAIAASQSESAVGVNVGGDVAYFFTPNVGVGGTAQSSGATVEMTVPSGTADVKAGGLQVGGGLRLRFSKSRNRESGSRAGQGFLSDSPVRIDRQPREGTGEVHAGGHVEG